ncbi:hypothetical protein H696_04612 [Fonticula alba]|uniref:Uncharacterized protein n=1 Tax=Fonticula alba TaxID=691883 RepID=A0A058Z6P3_FONAL|nr:hypothetical protein H696_04612 [Fonticula alba]KCV69202.1 hypothetical protein H696_04612 [Fonticula alba]|eukprot:XP_009496773.1 hypothetical protein H696_04612 [Fonticula alba]
MGIITAVTWVRMGVAQALPTIYEPTEEELAQLSAIADQHALLLQENPAAEEGDDAVAEDELMRNAHLTSKKLRMNDSLDSDDEADGELEQDDQIPDDLAEYGLGDYDAEIAAQEDVSSFNLIGGVKGLQYHERNEDDPYITVQDASDDEIDDIVIRPTDRLVLAAKTEDELSTLEIQVYEEADSNLFGHHDLMLPSFPLCLEWLDYRVGMSVDQSAGKLGNFVAVGTFEPDIEIWDLDVMDSLFPTAVLGNAKELATEAGALSTLGNAATKKKKSKKGSDKPAPEMKFTGHTDAVLGLSWNKAHRNLLASCSADTTVRLWDLQTAQSIHSYAHHRSKVQCIQWNPAETTAMLSGGYDKRVCAWDSRAPTAVREWAVSADVEALRWDPFDPHCFAVSTEDGFIRYYDARSGQTDTPLFQLMAHDATVTALDFSTTIRKVMLTASFDGTIKLWDIASGKPSMSYSRDMGMGKIFDASFSPDAAMLVAVASSKGNLHVWDAWQANGVRRQFAADRLVSGIVVPEQNIALSDMSLEEETPKGRKAKAEALRANLRQSREANAKARKK